MALTEEPAEAAHRFGYVAIVGRPNVGKSTLLNRLLGQKISITSRRPQTTRHRILGINTGPGFQIAYVDTPGLHLKAKRAINRYMNRAADSALHDVDVIVFVFEALKWTAEDSHIAARLQALKAPVIAVINKVDRVARKDQLLPYIDSLRDRLSWVELVPLSAKTGDNSAVLEQAVLRHLPYGPRAYPEEQVTDRPLRFLVAELVREQLMRRLGDELPYGVNVEVENYAEEPHLIRIDAVIWVDRKSHKSIVIGEQGQSLKRIGTDARKAIQALVEKGLPADLGQGQGELVG